MKQPYKYWNKGKLLEMLQYQCLDFGIDSFMVKQMVYDYRWNPITDYNGCNLVQDKYHPFLPCFIHDYRWIVEGGGIDSDLEFRINLVKSGMSKFESWKWFLGVRLGWLFYYKWVR